MRLSRLLLPLVALGTSALAPQLHADDSIGRLFFTPERRIALDRARQFNIEEQQVAQQNVVTVEGIVSRSSGRTTAWVNGVAVPEGGLVNLRARPGKNNPSVAVQPTNEPATSIVVGTAFNRTTGEHVDPLGGGFVARSGSARIR